ncbi:hypothetical protein [Pseudonocardia endophytica]|uniref:Putative amidophosphoribosyltransferase n=1 Tax=Pseudonocardia endophytica TaxID=401976 RepID=A0A4R1HZ79_PSEEN|nr:hypothetical protein [Pseudonocardia endophytica]TCK25429.1 putative amidophosphoribosyltransferase [Pseudonocardia endophytica]
MTGSLQQFAGQARAYLFSQVGDCFTNTARGPGRCSVCTSPTGFEHVQLCGQCSRQRSEFGDDVADLVIPLTYVRGYMSPQHQSQHMVQRYKSPVQPSEWSAGLLQFMINAATAIHGPCIAAAVGWWDVMTFVPSERRPGKDHPVVELARHVFEHGRSVDRVMLAPTENIAHFNRYPRRDIFALTPEFAAVVRGKHVLVVDDTWVSGGKAQSASLTLKAAGATRVTVLCVARWLSYKWDEHRPVIESKLPPYDAMICPVGPGACLASL